MAAAEAAVAAAVAAVAPAVAAVAAAVAAVAAAVAAVAAAAAARSKQQQQAKSCILFPNVPSSGVGCGGETEYNPYNYNQMSLIYIQDIS